MRPTIPHLVGPPLVWIPLIYAAQGTAVVANTFGANIQLHGYTLWHQRIAFASSALAAMLAVGLGLVLARRLLGGRWGPAYAAVAILLGTRSRTTRRSCRATATRLTPAAPPAS